MSADDTAVEIHPFTLDKEGASNFLSMDFTAVVTPVETVATPVDTEEVEYLYESSDEGEESEGGQDPKDSSVQEPVESSGQERPLRTVTKTDEPF